MTMTTAESAVAVNDGASGLSSVTTALSAVVIGIGMLCTALFRHSDRILIITVHRVISLR